MSVGFARACGYIGESPALLDAFEAIRQCGIRQARQEHHRRKAIIDQLKLGEDMFLAAIGPALSAEEAIEDATRFIAFWLAMPRWRQERRLPHLMRARQQLLAARFFRRHGHRIWRREAA